MNNYEKLERLRLTAEQVRLIKLSLSQAWGKLYVAATLLNQNAEFQRVSFEPSQNKHFKVTRAWLKDAINRYPELRLAQLDAEESMLDMVEFQAIQQAIGTKTADGKAQKPNLQAIQFILTTRGKKRGYGFNQSDDEDYLKQIQARVVEILNQATPDAIVELSKIPPFQSVVKRLEQAKQEPPQEPPKELLNELTNEKNTETHQNPETSV